MVVRSFGKPLTTSYRGVFHIAEVTSRLISHKDFIKLVESFGFHLEEHVRRDLIVAA